MMIFRPLALLLAAALLGGCKSSSPTPSRVCDAYLSCLAAVEPSSFPGQLQVYQADGPCWKTEITSSGCEKACAEGYADLAAHHPGVAACVTQPDGGPTGDASALPDWPSYPPPTPTKNVDVLFMIDNSNGMETIQDNLQKNLSRFIEALRSPKVGALPNLRIGVVSSDLGAGPFSFQTCEAVGGDGGVLKTGPGKLSAPGCAVPKDPWIEYRDDGNGPVTNVQNSKNTDKVEQVKEALSCVAYLGVGGCGFEQPLEAVRRALDGCQASNKAACKTNPGFVRADAGLVVVLVTNEDDCSAQNPKLFDPAQQGLNDPLGPLNSFRCTEFGLVCDEPLRLIGSKHHCQPGLDYLYSVADYVGFFKSLKPPQRLLVAALGGPVDPVEVEYDGLNPMLKTSCRSSAGSGVPAIRLKAVIDGLGSSGLFNKGMGETEVDICSRDFTPMLQLVGQRVTQWY